ncbi:MAG: hypothetical protein ACKOBW_17425 [Planctomycetota bacterium]
MTATNESLHQSPEVNLPLPSPVIRPRGGLRAVLGVLFILALLLALLLPGFGAKIALR